MLPHPAPVPQSPRRFGVGIDTARYGRCAAFLREDLQPAAADLSFPESGASYARLRQRLEDLARRHAPACFAARVDVAGQYADNLLQFLHGLGAARAAGTPAPLDLVVSRGDPQRDKNYRAAVFGSQKSDPVEARAAARFALTERPAAERPLPVALRGLRQVAARLQAVVRQRTRLVNQLHHLLALTFPELALRTKDLAAGWVLELVHRYPTAALVAAATPADLGAVPSLPEAHVAPLLEDARTSVASLAGTTDEELVRDQVRQLRDAGARKKRLENLLVSAYRALPQANHLDSIPGIGDVTAAVLTAPILDIERFATPGKWVAYSGALPIEASSGVDRAGQATRAQALGHEPAGQRPGAPLPVDGGPQRRAPQPRGAGAVRARRRPARRAQGGGRRPRPPQAPAPGVRHLEDRPAVQPRALSLADAGPRRAE